MKPRKPKNYTVDAKGVSLGRLASKIAQLLRGKNEVDFVPHENPLVFVRVTNVSELKFTPKKKAEVRYRHTGWPGGLKQPTLATLGPERTLRLAVLRMLKKNRLRTKLMKHLTIEL